MRADRDIARICAMQMAQDQRALNGARRARGG
jgi:hypothetical protein